MKEKRSRRTITRACASIARADGAFSRCESTRTAGRPTSLRRNPTPPRSYKTRGIVLRGRQLAEADRIITFFTRERGKIDAVAKGVRRTRSHLAGRLELATECELLMHRGRSLDVVVSAAIVYAPWPAVVQPERYAVFSLVAEIVDAFCEPDLEMPEVYDLLAGVISAITASAAPSSLVPRFSLRLLDLLGLAPPLDRCVSCGSAFVGDAVWLDAQSGGFIDVACRARWRDLPQLETADLDNLRRLASAKGSKMAAVQATPAASTAVEELVAHHLGRRPKAVAHLGGLGA